jgi:hypothetical protein
MSSELGFNDEGDGDKDLKVDGGKKLLRNLFAYVLVALPKAHIGAQAMMDDISMDIGHGIANLAIDVVHGRIYFVGF